MRIQSAAVLALVLMATLVSAAGAGEAEPSAPIAVAYLVSPPEQGDICFGDQFLTQIARDTHINVLPHLVLVDPGTPGLFDHPFAILSGSGALSLTSAQRDNLKRYLAQGGFLLASARCGDKGWAADFRSLLATLFPDQSLAKLQEDHLVFHSVYQIVTSAHEKRRREQLPWLESLTLDGRTVVIFSPQGLNDSANAGADCCCCGGREVRKPGLVNANILAYSLTQ